MVLNFGERGSARVDKPMQPLAFSGEWAPGCALIAGPTEDFNVMTDRQRIRHRVERVDASPTARVLQMAPTLAIFTVVGAKLGVDGGPLDLGARDTLIVEGANEVTLVSTGLALSVGLFPMNAT